MDWLRDMSKKTKIIVAILACLIFFAVAYMIVHNILSKQNKENEPVIEYNKSAEILKDREVNGLTIHDISLQVTDTQSNYRAKATNNTDKKIEFVGIALTFYDATAEIGTIKMYKEGTIEPDETIDLVNSSDMNLLKATDVKFELVGE